MALVSGFKQKRVVARIGEKDFNSNFSSLLSRQNVFYACLHVTTLVESIVIFSPVSAPTTTTHNNQSQIFLILFP